MATSAIVLGRGIQLATDLYGHQVMEGPHVIHLVSGLSHSAPTLFLGSEEHPAQVLQGDPQPGGDVEMNCFSSGGQGVSAHVGHDGSGRDGQRQIIGVMDLPCSNSHEGHVNGPSRLDKPIDIGDPQEGSELIFADRFVSQDLV